MPGQAEQNEEIRRKRLERRGVWVEEQYDFDSEDGKKTLGTSEERS